MPSTLFALVVLLAGYACVFAQQHEETCAWNDASCYQDPHLTEIDVDLGKGFNETFLAYVPPDVATFYQEEPGSRRAVKPSFTGQFGKFVNMSPNPIRIYW